MHAAARRARKGEQDVAYRRALMLMLRNARARGNLAWLLVKSGRTQDALRLAASAALLEPWSAPLLDTYAAALFAVGRCPEALTTEQRAIELLSEGRGQSAAGLPEYTTGLAAYAKACATPLRDGAGGAFSGGAQGFARRETLTLLMVTAFCGLSEGPVGTLAISWTTFVGAHSPKMV